VLLKIKVAIFSHVITNVGVVVWYIFVMKMIKKFVASLSMTLESVPYVLIEITSCSILSKHPGRFIVCLLIALL
jgi:hypothetical protein